MNSAEYVGKLIEELKAQGKVLSDVAWEAELACVEWAYVYGARGEYCTPENRRARYSADHPTIKSKCKNFNGSSSAGCKGCKWYPNEKYTRFFDCRGFTYWILKQVYKWELMGAGATSQWNTEKNWKAKGEIGTMPKDTLCCLFVRKGAKMEHTGFGLNDMTVECSSGVQFFEHRKEKWTHWGVPACEEGDVPGPGPVPHGYAEVTGKNVALRKDPSTSAVIITRIKTGEKVKIEPYPPKEWDYVSYAGKKGWMMREFLDEKAEGAVVTGKRVALRVDPCTRSKVILRVNTWETVKYEPEPAREWDYVSYAGKTGWMMREFLKEG